MWRYLSLNCQQLAGCSSIAVHLGLRQHIREVRSLELCRTTLCMVASILRECATLLCAFISAMSPFRCCPCPASWLILWSSLGGGSSLTRECCPCVGPALAMCLMTIQDQGHSSLDYMLSRFKGSQQRTNGMLRHVQAGLVSVTKSGDAFAITFEQALTMDETHQVFVLCHKMQFSTTNGFSVMRIRIARAVCCEIYTADSGKMSQPGKSLFPARTVDGGLIALLRLGGAMQVSHCNHVCTRQT